jgi:hypothetical protein
MQQIQLYIEDERVDLFEDESIVVTDSIKDIKDITKTYTAFSQQFNLPASKINNRIFKHYYNYEITNGFDARLRKNAIIKVNGADYKIGKIQLNSVDIKNQKPYSYKVVFYGNTISLKDLLGDDMLEDLDLSAYNHAFDGTTQIQGLQTAVSSTNFNIRYPLISHTKNFDVDTTNGFVEFNTTNKASYTDFKPAIRLIAIIDAIKAKYNIDFGYNFFSSYYFYNLFMWLHRDKGVMRNADEETQLITNIFSFVLDSGDDIFNLIDFETYYDFWSVGRRFRFSWEVTIGTGDEYQLQVVDRLTNTTIQEATGTGTTTLNFLTESYGSRFWDLDFIVTSDNVLGITQTLNVQVENQENYFDDWDWTLEYEGDYSYASASSVNQVVIRQQMPKMKVIDFITNIFKMHNLVAFVDRIGLDEIVEVEDLPLYYNNFNTYEVSKYIDFKKYSIEKFYPYKEVSFSFSGNKTILTEALNEFKNGDDFGNLSYIDDDPINKDAGKYEIKVDFEKMYFERLRYTDTNGLSPIQWGYFVDKDQNPIVNKPLIFLMENRVTSGNLSVYDGTSNVALTTYNAPVNYATYAGVNYSTHFGLELDEWSGNQIDETSTLFYRYYRDYILRIYNRASRKMVCTAYLPMHILLNYKLKDTFIIEGNEWKIESIKTNFLKQESKLTLFNDLEGTILTPQGINRVAQQVTNLNAVNSGGTDINLTWDSVSGASGYNIYVGGKEVDTTATNSYTLVTDNNKYSYDIGVQVDYTAGYKSKINYVTTTGS